MNNKENYNRSREWTILVYAAGNNDLNSYISKQFKALTHSEIPQNVKVIIQVSRPSKSLCAENYLNQELKGTWRYIIRDNKAQIIDYLGTLNMAKPYTLFDFLMWGSKSYPSNNLMVILSGHGAGIVGVLEENFDNGLSIMGIRGLAEALSNFNKITKKEIDILIFDTCYMNSIEILYEISLTSNLTNSYAIIPKDNPLIEGLPWHKIISTLGECNTINMNLQYIVNEIVNVKSTKERNYELLAVRLLKDNFIELSREIDYIAKIIIFKRSRGNDISNSKKILNNIGSCAKNDDYIDLFYLVKSINLYYSERYEYYNEVLDYIKKIIVNSKENEQYKYENSGLKLFFPRNLKVYSKYHDIYRKMLFSSDCKWMQVLNKKYDMKADKKYYY